MENRPQNKKEKLALCGTRLIISIKEARKILGKQAHMLSDYQIENMIIVLTDMSERLLQNTGSKLK